MKTIEVEYYVARHFNWRANIIVPNVSWGIEIHECDLLILTKNNYAYEVEIKVSRSDLKRDQQKKHKHKDGISLWGGPEGKDRIKFLWFAIPEELEKDIDLIPKEAGILSVKKRFGDHNGEWSHQVFEIRKPTKKSDYQFSKEEIFNIARLGTMRIWGLKKKLCIDRMPK